MFLLYSLKANNRPTLHHSTVPKKCGLTTKGAKNQQETKGKQQQFGQNRWAGKWSLFRLKNNPFSSRQSSVSESNSRRYRHLRRVRVIGGRKTETTWERNGAQKLSVGRFGCRRQDLFFTRWLMLAAGPSKGLGAQKNGKGAYRGRVDLGVFRKCF